MSVGISGAGSYLRIHQVAESSLLRPTGAGMNFDDGDVLLSKPYRKDELAKAVAEVLAAVRA